MTYEEAIREDELAKFMRWLMESSDYEGFGYKFWRKTHIPGRFTAEEVIAEYKKAKDKNHEI